MKLYRALDEWSRRRKEINKKTNQPHQSTIKPTQTTQLNQLLKPIYHS